MKKKIPDKKIQIIEEFPQTTNGGLDVLMEEMRAKAMFGKDVVKVVTTKKSYKLYISTTKQKLVNIINQL